MARSKKVLVLHVGGTIGMVRSETGYAPQRGMLEAYLADMAELRHPDVPSHEVEVLEPLLDSADMQPEDWARIARAIVRRYAHFDGFVVLHGTDTMAYTASALSFLLPGLSKPVVLTGAQLSLESPRSDGREHLVTSIAIAGTQPIPEVTIYFASRLFRGNRAQKVHNDQLAAFDSGNLPALAEVGVSFELRTHLLLPKGRGVPGAVDLRGHPEVAALRMFPGMTPRLVRDVLDDVQGCVLETYGAGNAPTRDADLLEAIREATARGVVVVNCSQCHGGRVRQELYRTGSALVRAGVTSGHDMTPEAALTKLYVLLARGLPSAEVRARMEQDLAGELTQTR